MNKPNKNKHLDTEKRIMIPRERSVVGVAGSNEMSKGDQLDHDGWDLLAVDHTVGYVLSLFSH